MTNVLCSVEKISSFYFVYICFLLALLDSCMNQIKGFKIPTLYDQYSTYYDFFVYIYLSFIEIKRDLRTYESVTQ